MALMGRVLQGAGWLWIAAGVASQITGFGELSWFPGVVLLFVARLLRTQARRTAPPETGEPLQSDPMASPLPKPTIPPPPVAKRQPPPPPPTEPTPEPAKAAEPAPAAPIASPGSPPPPEPGYKPMTSDEMIAAARKRWDRPRR